MRVYVIGFILILLAAGLLAACTSQPAQPDPYSPWFNIPKPVRCGPHCQQWVEPGMMVHPIKETSP